MVSLEIRPPTLTIHGANSPKLSKITGGSSPLIIQTTLRAILTEFPTPPASYCTRFIINVVISTRLSTVRIIYPFTKPCQPMAKGRLPPFVVVAPPFNQLSRIPTGIFFCKQKTAYEIIIYLGITLRDYLQVAQTVGQG